MLTQVSVSRVARLGTLGVRGEDYHFFASCAEYLQEELTMCEGSLRGLRHTLSRGECGESGRWDAVGLWALYVPFPCSNQHIYRYFERQMNVRDTHAIGLVSHTAVLHRLVELGFEVLLPWASHLGYDLAYYRVEEHLNFGFFLHREAHLVRIQVKTGRLLDNGTSFDFNTVSVAPGKGKHRKKDYEGKAEYFAVHLPDNGKVYMIPVNGVPTSGPLTLRFKAAGLLLGGRYGTKRVPYEEAVRMKYSLWWAEDYEI